jgi:C1A family cysteine protease
MKIYKSFKFFVIIIVLLFFGTSFISVSTSIFTDDQIKSYMVYEQSTLNQYVDTTSDYCGCNDGSIISDLSDINNRLPHSVDISNEDLPDYFNWKDYEGEDWTTPVKSQYVGNGPLPRRCGSCVVFAAMGALESVIKIREGYANLTPDLSEQYVLSCLPAVAYPYYGKGCSGGNGEKIFECIISTTEEGNFHNGVPFESCFPYQAKDLSQGVTCDQKCSDWLEYLVPLSDHGFTIIEGVLENTPESIELIKNMIMQHGPITAGMETTLRYLLWGLTHHSPEDYLPYKGREWRNSVNHAVTIIGWKDDPSIGNGGYWICKNTIGTFYANKGIFNIEYGALFIGVAVIWADYDPNSFDWPPNTPSIRGSASCNPNQKYEYTFTSMDPDGVDDVFYYIDWGDSQVEEWIGPFESGGEVTVNHVWENKGTYNIRVKAKDTSGLESDWGVLSVNMPKNKQLINTPFQIFMRNHPLIYQLMQRFLKL